MLHVSYFMRISFFSDTFLPDINSISVSLQTLSHELANHGHNVSIFTNQSSENNIDNDFEKPQLIEIYRAKNEYFNLKNIFHPINPGFRDILSLNPDVIHAHTPFFAGHEARKVARILKLPLIGSHHTFYANYIEHIIKSRSFLSEFLLKKEIIKFYNSCKIVIVPSKTIAENLIKNGLTAPVSIIPNSIDISKFKPSAQKDILKKRCGLPEFSLVYFGKITYEKRIHELLKVFALLSPKYPKIKLSLIGDGPERKNLEKFAKRLNIRDKVIFFGMLIDQNFIDAVAANDIFITASDTENQPLPIFEAMALGLPQIVAKSPIDEYVEHGTTGLITERYSFIELSKEITKLIENPTLRQKMSENSQKAAQKYAIENIVLEYEKLYNDFIKIKY